MDLSQPIVYVDRRYVDPDDSVQPWSRIRRLPVEPEWVAYCEDGERSEGSPGFDSVEDAIAWGRERAEIVLVRLGGDVEAIYSAGRAHAAERTDGTGWRFPAWPPKGWPSYDGPPEPGWPEYDNDDEPLP